MSHTPDTSLSRRRWLSAGAVALPAWLPALSPGLLPAESFAQDVFPSRPIRIILPFPPGQATDIITRLIAERLGTLWKQTLIVDSRGGKLRVLAATTKERLPQLPAVPTIAESGFPGFEAAGWATVMLPAGTPAALINQISTDVQIWCYVKPHCVTRSSSAARFPIRAHRPRRPNSSAPKLKSGRAWRSWPMCGWINRQFPNNSP